MARFGQLDDYYIFDELTVYFGNGNVNVDPKYEPQLLALAEKAKNIEGYVIKLRGYKETFRLRGCSLRVLWESRNKSGTRRAKKGRRRTAV